MPLASFLGRGGPRGHLEASWGFPEERKGERERGKKEVGKKEKQRQRQRKRERERTGGNPKLPALFTSREIETAVRERERKKGRKKETKKERMTDKVRRINVNK